ncbi:MAG: outer membrane protein assembly factor BamA [Epsilonproteobacteria bacterium]|nr:outer membrane protein assembly factor BamA [Campylobacterota bacterium]
MKKAIIFFPLLALALTIQNIEYKGLIHISPISANAIIDIKKGDEFDIEKIDSSIKKLYKSGYFQTVAADINGSVLTFICHEKPTLAGIELINFSQDLEKLLKEQNLLPKRGNILNMQKLNELKKFIKSYYQAKGYFNTTLLSKTTPLPNNRVKLTLILKKGKQITIRKVKFYGAKIDKDILYDEIENRPRTFWSILPFTNSGRLNLFKLIEDKQALQDFYYNLGYIDAKVSNPLAKINFDTDFADIEYKIKEGKRYIVKDIQINYPKNIKVKLPKFKLKKNKYFNVTALRKDIEDLKHAFEDLGYAYAKVFPQVEKDKNSVTIIYNVTPGNIFYIRNVIIKGNNKTLDRVIRRNIYLAPKDRYSYTDFKDSVNSLKRKGYLEGIKISKKRVSPNELDLIVSAKDGLSGTLRAGISYGTYTKLGFNLAISEKNVFGSGQSLSVSGDFSSVSRTYKLSLFNPRVLDTKYSLNTAIFNTSFEGVSYTSKQRGGYIGVGKKLNRFTSANITYGYVTTDLSDYNTTEYIKPNSVKSYISLSLTYNNTDDYFFPTSGIKAAISSEFAGIGGDEKFIKTIAKAKYYYPITNKIYKTIAVLKYRMIAGKITDTGYLPINEKFYLGGAKTVRGFNWYSISPVDDEDNKIGGKYEFITGPEISTPLSTKSRLWLTGFIDYGAVGENKLNITRSSYGFELDWISPMGPISFIWAWPIHKEDGDDLQRFEFSLGASF